MTLSYKGPIAVLIWNCSSFQGEASLAQSQPGVTVATMPYYTQPTTVNVIPRPQLLISTPSQPPFHAGPRPMVAPSAPVPTQQVQWQQLQYQDMRSQAFQPMVHCGTVPQATVPPPGMMYRVPPSGGVHFVRGVKELHGQGTWMTFYIMEVERITFDSPDTCDVILSYDCAL